MTPLELMTISAIRYALGRSSYIVGETIDWVTSMEKRGEKFNFIAKKDIDEELSRYPDMSYVDEWRKLSEFLTPQS